MAFFNWFTKKSDSNAAMLPGSAVQKAHGSHAIAPPAMTPFSPATPPAALRPPADPTNLSEERKAKRQVRREQLYLAIRQAMTRSGVLAASFKFKVLSLDQRGDQFLVMMDVHPSLGLQEEKLQQSEALVMQIAKAQFDMLVSAVYWRIDSTAGQDKAKQGGQPSMPDAIVAGAATAVGTTPEGSAGAIARKPVAPRFEPIDEGEMTAFRRALGASAVQTTQSVAQLAPTAGNWSKTMATSGAAVIIESAAKSRSGLHSYTLLTGFEDTEMPELAELPALSTTQYGDLN